MSPMPVRATEEPAGGADLGPVTRRVMRCGLPVAVVFAALASRPITDNGVLSHLAIGRLQLESGLPGSNPFLYSSTGFPVPSWWWSWTLAAHEALLGGRGLRLLGAVLGAALGLLLVRLVVTGLGGPGAPGLTRLRVVTVVVPCALVAVIVMPFLNLRPHLAGFLLLGAALVVVLERRSPWWLMAVFATWVNIHGSWLYGLIVLGAVVVARAVDDRRIEPADLVRVGAASVGVVIGAAIHPDRFSPLVLPWRQMGDPLEREALRSYDEWAALGPGEPATWALVALGVLAVVGALRGRRVATAGLCLGLVLVGLSSSRVAPIAALALVPLVAPTLAGVGSMALPTGRSARVMERSTAVLASLVLAAALLGPGHQLDRYPVAAIDWLEERGLATEPVRLASHDYVGNYLSWRHGSSTNTFVDDRPAARTLIAYRQLLRLEDGWEQVLVEAAPDVVVWQSESGLTGELAEDRDWIQAFEADGYTVFCRSTLAERCS